MAKVVQWCDWEGEGLDFCSLSQHGEGWLLEGVVIGSRKSRYGARYSVVVDASFVTREVRVDYVGGCNLHVRHDGEGVWHDLLRERPIVSLMGCKDVDIGVTPATNTLPIRRLGLSTNESIEIDVAYVPLPAEIGIEFLPQKAKQRYTCIEQGRTYRYEGIFRGFVADLEVDADSLVLNYPETFRRIQ